MRADGVSEEMIARFVAEEMEEDEFRRGKGVTEIEVKDKDFDAEYCEAVARFAAGVEEDPRAYPQAAARQRVLP